MKLLPQTDEALGEFTKGIIDAFELPNNEMTELTIFQVIYNMPNGKAYVEEEEIANQVRKSIANDIVGRRLSAYHIKRKEEAQAAALAAKQEDTAKAAKATEAASGSVQNSQISST